MNLLSMCYPLSASSPLSGPWWLDPGSPLPNAFGFMGWHISFLTALASLLPPLFCPISSALPLTFFFPFFISLLCSNSLCSSPTTTPALFLLYVGRDKKKKTLKGTLHRKIRIRKLCMKLLCQSQREFYLRKMHLCREGWKQFFQLNCLDQCFSNCGP